MAQSYKIVDGAILIGRKNVAAPHVLTPAQVKEVGESAIKRFMAEGRVAKTDEQAVIAPKSGKSLKQSSSNPKAIKTEVREKHPDKSIWVLDPKMLKGKDMEELLTMVVERDADYDLGNFTEPEQVIEFLSQDFEG